MFTHLSNWELALSCNGKILAIGNAAAKISVWDLEVSKEIYTFWKDLKPITALNDKTGRDARSTRRLW